MEAWALFAAKSVVGKDRLVIIGDLSVPRRPERRVTTAGLAKMQFIGTVPQAGKCRAGSASDLLCRRATTRECRTSSSKHSASGDASGGDTVAACLELVSEGQRLLVPPGKLVLSRINWHKDCPERGMSRPLKQSVAHLTWANIAAKNWCSSSIRLAGKGARVSLA